MSVFENSISKVLSKLVANELLLKTTRGKFFTKYEKSLQLIMHPLC